jgi:hypothetical protein
MGIDFLFYTLPACRLTDDRQDRLLRLVAELDEDDAPPSNYESHAEYQDGLRQAVAFLSKKYHHDLSLWLPVAKNPANPLRFPVWITGGDSYGDYPSSAAEYLDLLADCPQIVRQLLDWIVEDQAPQKKAPPITLEASEKGGVKRQIAQRLSDDYTTMTDETLVATARQALHVVHEYELLVLHGSSRRERAYGRAAKDRLVEVCVEIGLRHLAESYARKLWMNG